MIVIVLAQLSHQCVSVGWIKNLYLIYFCTAADLLKPGLSWKINQLKIYTDAKSNCSGLDKVSLRL